MLVAGCGGLPSPGGAQAVAGPCSLTVSGAVSGEVKCAGEIISYESIMNASTFALSGGAVGSTTATLDAGDLIWTAMPQANVYSPPGLVAGAASLSQMVNGKTHAWIMRFSPSPPTNEPNTGAFQLNLTSAATITSSAVATEYYAHGSVQLTLEDQDPTPEPEISVAGEF